MVQYETQRKTKILVPKMVLEIMCHIQKGPNEKMFLPQIAATIHDKIQGCCGQTLHAPRMVMWFRQAEFPNFIAILKSNVVHCEILLV